jgi:prepilin-type N-terminal cleavage/methylation domain-containing protein
MNKKDKKNLFKIILNNEKGLTLVELIIALAISVIVVAAAGFILLTQSGVIRLSRSVSAEQQNLNNAFNTVRYSLRLAGFDQGQQVFVDNSTTILPVLIIPQQTYGGITYPYEVEISYFSPPQTSPSLMNLGAGCTISNPTGTEFQLSSSCSISDFQAGEILNVSNAVPQNNAVKQLCITHIDTVNNKLQFNHGVDSSCEQMNPTPPNLPSSASISVALQPSGAEQFLFYWGNGYKSINGTCPNGGSLENFSNGEWCTYSFNYPFDKPGHLYQCTVQSSPNINAMPVCEANSAVSLSNYIYNFSVTPLGNPNTSFSFPKFLPYTVQYNAVYNTYILTITGESSVALSDSPAYSVDVPYNSNANGTGAIGNAGQTVGNNILKTLSSNIFLRNVYYGS